jgi:hypothetical protein
VGAVKRGGQLWEVGPGGYRAFADRAYFSRGLARGLPPPPPPIESNVVLDYVLPEDSVEVELTGLDIVRDGGHYILLIWENWRSGAYAESRLYVEGDTDDGHYYSWIVIGPYALQYNFPLSPAVQGPYAPAYLAHVFRSPDGYISMSWEGGENNSSCYTGNFFIMNTVPKDNLTRILLRSAREDMPFLAGTRFVVLKVLPSQILGRWTSSGTYPFPSIEGGHVRMAAMIGTLPSEGTWGYFNDNTLDIDWTQWVVTTSTYPMSPTSESRRFFYVAHYPGSMVGYIARPYYPRGFGFGCGQFMDSWSGFGAGYRGATNVALGNFRIDVPSPFVIQAEKVSLVSLVEKTLAEPADTVELDFDLIADANGAAWITVLGRNCSGSSVQAFWDGDLDPAHYVGGFSAYEDEASRYNTDYGSPSLTADLPLSPDLYVHGLIMQGDPYYDAARMFARALPGGDGRWCVAEVIKRPGYYPSGPIRKVTLRIPDGAFGAGTKVMAQKVMW